LWHFQPSFVNKKLEPELSNSGQKIENPGKTITLRSIILVLFFIVLIPLLPLIISRHWNWWEAWAYAAINILSFAISRWLAAQHNPDLIAERARILNHKDAKSWDKLLSLLLGIAGISLPLVAGLDALFGWSPSFNLPVKIVSLVFILAGYVLSSYALIENRFFSGVVRIQTDRGHQVVTSGPYRWIRHPGYAGALLTYLFTPFFLNSYWIFLPVLVLIVILVIRTNLEDRTLQNELEGYRNYVNKVRYRLLPGIW
jgi:protein-S-isoprenylcysteine O-methyltransferase Ste14